MKKLIITTIFTSSFLLLGCGDSNQKFIDKETKYIEEREDMYPYHVEFKGVKFLPEDNESVTEGGLCGEIRLSQKSSAQPIKLPNMYFSNMADGIEVVINSKEYFKFMYVIKPNSDKSKKNQPIVIVYPYDKTFIDIWTENCQK